MKWGRPCDQLQPHNMSHIIKLVRLEVALHILLNASNLGATGPEVLIRNMVPLLGALAPNDDFTLLLPFSKQTKEWGLPGNVRVQYVRRTRIHELSRMWDIYIGLARICKSSKADVCLTLGDIGPIDLPVPHMVYLHQPYLVYPEQELNASLPWLERLKLYYQRWHFQRSVNNAKAVIVQTPVMADRLVRLYGIDRKSVHVMRPALPAHLQTSGSDQHETYLPMLAFPSCIRLLFLATYYAHKNHAILPSLISELRQRQLSGKVHFFLTLDGNRRHAETVLLRKLESEQDMVTNLGRLRPEEAGLALHAADALFMPTLVETFGLIYLEAMAAHKPILTSNRDFANYMCGDLALYFDPMDPVSIADAIERLIAELPRLQTRLRAEAEKQISSVSQSHTENAEEILSLLRTQVLHVTRLAC